MMKNFVIAGAFFLLSTLAVAEKTAKSPKGFKSNYVYLENIPNEKLTVHFDVEKGKCKENISLRSYKHESKVTDGEVEVWHLYARCVPTNKPQNSESITNLTKMAHIHVTYDEGLKLSLSRK